jgi:hypothetical protein
MISKTDFNKKNIWAFTPIRNGFELRLIEIIENSGPSSGF